MRYVVLWMHDTDGWEYGKAFDKLEEVYEFCKYKPYTIYQVWNLYANEEVKLVDRPR